METIISEIALSNVSELCPEKMSGYVMGIWWLTSMLAGPIGVWAGALTTPLVKANQLTAMSSMHIYAHVFFEIGLVTGAIALAMWLSRPLLNRLLQRY